MRVAESRLAYDRYKGIEGNGMLNFALKHGFTVSDEMLTAIGCTVVCQSHVELQLGLLINKLLNVEDGKGFAFTSTMSFKHLCTAVSALVVEATGEDDPRFEEVRELLAGLQRFEEFRNQVAHSVWAHADDFSALTARRIKATARRNRKVQHHSETVELEKISVHITAAMEAHVRLVILVSAIAGKPVNGIEPKDAALSE